MQHPSTEMRPRQFKLRRQLRRPREKRLRHPRRPRLRFSPTAWAKLLFLRDRGPTEVGGFGITPPDDLLYVQDVRLVRQRCTVVSVAFDDTAVAEFFDEQVDAGRKPEQFGRIWIHTHPADSALPSQLDEETYLRVFGRCDWAVMFILHVRGNGTAAYSSVPDRAANLRFPHRSISGGIFPRLISRPGVRNTSRP